jgi:hypothetical protein
MRYRPLLVSLVIAAACSAGLSGGASAATLFTTGAHTTRVAIGATQSLTTTTPWTYTSATSVLNSCSNSTLQLTLFQNTDAAVVATVTGGTFTGCTPFAPTGNFGTPWQLTVSGSPTTTGDITRWAASLSNVSFNLAGGTYTGSFTTGVTARQTGSSGAMCVDFNDAGTVSGPLSSNFRVDTSYCFEGAAATYSLT